jgi:hypothetical protein
MPTQSNLMGSGCPALQAQASVGIVSNNLTAAGSTQGTALVLPSDFNIVTTAAASTGAILPAAGPQCNVGDSFIVVNHGANSLSVYPPTGGKIGTGSVNAALALPSGKTGFYLHIGSGNYAGSVSA